MKSDNRERIVFSVNVTRVNVRWSFYRYRSQPRRRSLHVVTHATARDRLPRIKRNDRSTDRSIGLLGRAVGDDTGGCNGGRSRMRVGGVATSLLNESRCPRELSR